MRQEVRLRASKVSGTWSVVDRETQAADAISWGNVGQATDKRKVARCFCAVDSLVTAGTHDVPM